MLAGDTALKSVCLFHLIICKLRQASPMNIFVCLSVLWYVCRSFITLFLSTDLHECFTWNSYETYSKHLLECLRHTCHQVKRSRSCGRSKLLSSPYNSRLDGFAWCLTQIFPVGCQWVVHNFRLKGKWPGSQGLLEVLSYLLRDSELVCEEVPQLLDI